jgi:DNA-binding transcriptional LysR family regulator
VCVINVDMSQANNALAVREKRAGNEPNFMATVMALVESGLGVSLIPSCVRSLNRPQAVIRPIAPQSARIPLCVSWRKSAQNPPLAAFLDTVRTATGSIRIQMES